MLTRLSSLGDTTLGKGFCLRQGVFWHYCELVCRSAGLFAIREDMKDVTFMRLSQYPWCFIGELLI